jgi:hypothetical protein
MVDVNVFPHGKPAQFCREPQRRSKRRFVPLLSGVDPMSRLLVAYENSPRQGKIYLALNPSAPATVSRLQ